MSEQSEAAVQAAIGRGCGFAALCVGSIVNALAFAPIPTIKSGGYLSLIVAFFLVLLAGRAGGTSQPDASARRASESRSEPMIGAIRRRALLRQACRFAVAAAALLLIGLAGDLNLALHPPR